MTMTEIEQRKQEKLYAYSNVIQQIKIVRDKLKDQIKLIGVFLEKMRSNPARDLFYAGQETHGYGIGTSIEQKVIDAMSTEAAFGIADELRKLEIQREELRESLVSLNVPIPTY